MSLKEYFINEYLFESQEDVLTLKVFSRDKKTRICSCQLIVTGIDSIRVKNLITSEGTLSPDLFKNIVVWLVSKGYKFITYERYVGGKFVERDIDVQRFLKKHRIEDVHKFLEEVNYENCSA